MQKLFVILILSVFLLGNVGAIEWDNKLIYSNNDLKVNFENAFGLPIIGSELGTIELKSHKSVDEVLQFGYGKEEVVMYYDFTNWELYENGLGDIIFTDERTGKEIQKDYSFVYWTNETYQIDVYEKQCSILWNETKNCSDVFIGKENKIREVWKPYSSKDIPKDGIRIGLKTYVDKDDYIDAIWEIAGKEVSKHASWTASLNVDLSLYLKLDESSGTLFNSIAGGINLTSVNAPAYSQTGIIGTAVGGTASSGSFFKNSTAGTPISPGATLDYTIDGWIKTTDSGSSKPIMTFSRTGGGPTIFYMLTTGNLFFASAEGVGGVDVGNVVGGDVNDGSYHYFAVTRNESGTRLNLYMDGNQIDTNTGGAVEVSQRGMYLFEAPGLQHLDGLLDEIGIWDGRALTLSEIQQRYNGGSGITYTTIFGPTVTLNSPIDNSTSTTNNIQFNATATVEGGRTLTNMSLWTNETGSWELNDTKDYPTFDNFLDTTVNTTLWNVITTTGGCSSDLATVTEDGSYQIIFADSNPSYVCGPASNPSGTARSQTIDLFNYGDIFTIKFGQIDQYTTSDATSIMRVYVGTNIIWSNTETNGGTETYIGYKISIRKDGSTIYYDIFNGTAWEGEQSTTGTYIEFYSFGSHTVSSSRRGYTRIRVDSIGSESFKEETWNRTITEPIIWNVQACDSDGDCGFAPSNYSLFIDTNPPTISITSPNETFNYLKVNGTMNLNVTVTDTNLDTCWYNYNGTNQTFSCTTEVQANETFLQEANNFNITIYANDSVGNENSEISTWNYKVFENSRTLNLSSYETKQETFQIDVSDNASLTAVILDYNGTEYSTTKEGNIYSKTLDIPTGVQNRSVRWKFTYAGDSIYSDYSYQNISETIWTLCNATYTDDYLNVSFKDESTLAYINGTIQTSIFDYYLGSGAVNKTYTYTTAGNATNYKFCATPNETFNVDTYVNYLGDGYPNRIWEPELQTYNSTVTEKLLYLLASTDGIYVTFVTATAFNTAILGVDITISRDISGDTTTVSQGITDSAGSFTAWLNPNYDHVITATKTGYTTNTQTIRPTQTTYTLIMSTGAEEYTYVSDYAGLKWFVFPGVGIRNSTTSTNFGFNITARNENLDNCKIELLNQDKTIVLASAISASANGSSCEVLVAYSMSSTYPKVKGRLLIDVGNGYQLLEDDAYWAYLPFNATGMTFTDWFNGMKTLDLSYFNNDDQHREYTYILVFFLFVMIVCAVMNYAGWDIQNPGGMIFLVGTMVWIASVPGFLTLNYISPYLWIDKYFVAGVYSLFMIGYATRNLT